MTRTRLSPTAPREIRHALGRVATRLRTVAALKGLGTVALVGSLGAVVGMIADFTWPLTMLARWELWAAWLALTGLVATFAVIRPLFRPLGAVELAALAERGQPEIEERLVGSVALFAEGDRTHGSREMIDALAVQAAESAGAIDARRVISADRAVRRLAIGIAAVAIVALPAILQPDPFATLARRFFAPWTDLDRVGRFVLRVNPGDQVVALGSDLAINARLSPRAGFGFGVVPPGGAWLEWDDAVLGRTSRMRMASKDSGSPDTRLFDVRLPRIAGSINYRIVTEPLTSRRFTIEAVEPPKLVSISANVEPPAYTKLHAVLARDPIRLDVIEGSTITFTLVSNRRFHSIEFGWPAFDAPEPTTRPIEVEIGSDGTTAQVHGVAKAAGSYSYFTQIKRDEHGLDGLRESRKLIVRPDAPPTLFAKPVDAKEASPDDILTIPFAAHDDFAVASAELHYSIKRASSEAEPEIGKVNVPLQGLGSPRVSGEAALGLKPLIVNSGDMITYRLKILDNRPAPKGPNVTWSGEATLAIVAKAEPMLVRRDRLHRERIQERLEEIKKENLFNRQEITRLRYDADAAQRNPAGWGRAKDQALSDREGTARQVVDDLNSLAHDFDADPSYRSLARPTREIAEIEGEAGRAAIEAARRAPDASKRLASLRGADGRLGAVHQRIEELQRQFAAFAKLDEDSQKLRGLAAREDALAAEAMEVGPDQGRLDAIRAEQDNVRREFDTLANKSPELKAGLLEAQIKEAAALAEKARELATRQRIEARMTAEGTKRNATLKALADAQRQVEVDARRLAIEIDPALAENGRSGLNAQVLQNAVAPIERGEITTGRQQLEAGETELRRLARDLDDAPHDLKAFVRRLIHRQAELSRHVSEAIREVKEKNPSTAKEQSGMADAYKPLAIEQEAILKMTEAIKVDEPRKGAARDAAQAVARALENLRAVRPSESEGRQNEAKQALHRLAEAVPDSWHRDEPARKKLEDARRLADEATRELDRHLRETAPQPGKPDDRAKAAVELANRLAPTLKKQSEAAALLTAIDVPAGVEPQRRSAERRVKALADAIEAIQKQAGTLTKSPSKSSGAIREWQVVGPFKQDERPPFSLNQPIKSVEKFKGLMNKPVTFQLVKASDDRGKIDLGAAYSKDSNQSAFAYAEIVSPMSGTGMFTLGCDDTLLVWVNGKQVYKFDGDRSYHPDQGSFEVALPKGTSRVVVRSANHSGEWIFGIRVALPQAMTPELARMETLRAALSQVQAESRAALDRLTQKLHHQTPADDTAQELATEAAELAQAAAKPEAMSRPVARQEVAEHQHRLASALRSLPVPDASILQGEAVRLAESAAKILDDPKATGLAKAESVKQAAKAAKTLSDRLADRISPHAEVPPRERALPDPPRDPTLAALPSLAAEVKALARRERQIRESLQAILGERVEPQEELRREAAALGQEFTGLRDRSRESGPHGHGHANNAVDLLANQAPRIMDQGINEFAQGRPEPARDAQRRAAEIVERAAQAAEDLAQALKLDRPAEARHAADLGPAHEALAEVRRHLAREGKEQGPAPAGSIVAQAMQRAAQAMRTAAHSAPGRDPTGNDPPLIDAEILDPKSSNAGVVAADLAELQTLVRQKTGRRWGELPGHLRTEILQLSQGKYRDDYARLIQLYFKEIASDAARPENP